MIRPVIRPVTRFVSTCDECGIDGPDDHPTRDAAEREVCPCRTGDVIYKRPLPPPLDAAFASCTETATVR